MPSKLLDDERNAVVFSTTKGNYSHLTQPERNVNRELGSRNKSFSDWSVESHLWFTFSTLEESFPAPFFIRGSVQEAELRRRSLDIEERQ